MFYAPLVCFTFQASEGWETVFVRCPRLLSPKHTYTLKRSHIQCLRDTRRPEGLIQLYRTQPSHKHRIGRWCDDEETVSIMRLCPVLLGFLSLLRVAVSLSFCDYIILSPPRDGRMDGHYNQWPLCSQPSVFMSSISSSSSSKGAVARRQYSTLRIPISRPKIALRVPHPFVVFRNTSSL